MGFRVRDVPYEGDCMLQAVQRGLGLSEDDHPALRAEAVGEVACRIHANPELAKQLTADLSRGGNLTDHTPFGYLLTAGKPGVFLGSSEMLAIAGLKGVRFEVYSSTAACPFSGPTVVGSGPRPVQLLYVNGNHYMAVLPVEESGGSKVGGAVFL